MTADATTEISALLSNASARTLTLGIDKTGRVLQHDRNSADMLAYPGDALLGTELSSLLAGPSSHTIALEGLLSAALSGREGTAVLTFRTRDGDPLDSVVTIQPMRSCDPSLIGLVLIRIPPPSEGRFLDPAVMRHALLDGAFKRIGGALDIDQLAREFVNIAVPHFCNQAGLLILESLVAGEELPADSPDGSQLLRRLAVAYDDGDSSWDAVFPTGEILRYPPGTPYTECMATGKPVRLKMGSDQAARIATSWLRRPVAHLLANTSMLLLPLAARDVTLGFVVCTRKDSYRAFDAYDTEIGMEFASRAAIFIDNARRYSRERATAVTLQRSLLPTGLSKPSSVEVRHRYLPGSKLIEVGGDWYESIALPGARVALVVGDVAGHGVRAAVTMGRLRTAIHTLAMLELSPAETLQQLNELMGDLGAREPHFATCVYAVYDAVTGMLEVASAGHLPPLLVGPDGTNEFLSLTPAPPLGIGSGSVQSKFVPVTDGSLLVLYTDGLVENRTRDIDVGLRLLSEIFGPGAAARPLEDLCRATLAGVYSDQQRDDIALLMARLSRISADNHVSWTLPAELTSARRARGLIRRPLTRWNLADLIPVTELLVSELVTNSVRYAQGMIGLRLVLEGGLVVEVTDDSAALPRLRHPDEDDERGRGLQVISQFAQRWGARRTATGKVVWCEQALPHAGDGDD
ncbi:MAG TPA: SpoIIE family protein phosphatase [Streptosporangiaceae bacterium]|nr:SpoIIE family protein phosphatase [Streptosporangiaceae bacterium]